MEKQKSITTKAAGHISSGFQNTRLHHRSRKRIKELGEVFTPDAYVVDMLKLMNQKNRDLWSNENIILFEPCCGHGNIVAIIYKNRLLGLYKKALQLGCENPVLYAVANALNTLWAIDIDSRNVVHSKVRLFESSLEFIKEKAGISNDISVISSEPEFFAHLMCAINWHIKENETLSSLSDDENAQTNASKIQAGQKWFQKNGHNPIDFENSWANHFQTQQADKLLPFVFKRANRFIENLLSGNGRHDAEFEFANFLIREPTSTSRRTIRTKDLATG